jgi:hypothetical protein
MNDAELLLTVKAILEGLKNDGDITVAISVPNKQAAPKEEAPKRSWVLSVGAAPAAPGGKKYPKSSVWK